MGKIALFAIATIAVAYICSAEESGVMILEHNAPNAIACGRLELRNLTCQTGQEGSEALLGDPSSSAETELHFLGGMACNGLPGIGSWNDSNHVVIRYSASTGSLNVQVDASSSYCMELKMRSAPNLNYLQFDVVNRARGTTVRLNNVLLIRGTHRTRLGDFIGAGWNAWHIQDVDLTGGFTLEGDLILGWPDTPRIAGEEANKVIVQFGTLRGTPTASIGDNNVEGSWDVPQASNLSK